MPAACGAAWAAPAPRANKPALASREDGFSGHSSSNDAPTGFQFSASFFIGHTKAWLNRRETFRSVTVAVA
jgi:hypothetical protein